MPWNVYQSSKELVIMSKTQQRTIWRWVLAIVAYSLVGAALYFGICGQIEKAGLRPGEVSFYPWLRRIRLTVQIMIGTSFLFYAAWNFVMSRKLLGRVETRERANQYNLIAIGAHLGVFAIEGWFYVGFYAEWIFTRIFGYWWLYLVPVIVLPTVFCVTSRVFGPETCYVFKFNICNWRRRKTDS